MPSERYRSIRDAFTWLVPEYFNFGVDVVDRLAREADGLALISENDAGNSAVYHFSDIARLTNKLANALRARGIGKGGSRYRHAAENSGLADHHGRGTEGRRSTDPMHRDTYRPLSCFSRRAFGGAGGDLPRSTSE